MDYLKRSRDFKFYDLLNMSFSEAGNVEFIKDSENTKLNDISFKKSISDPTMLTTDATNSGMIIIPYAIGVAYPVGVVHHDILVL